MNTGPTTFDSRPPPSLRPAGEGRFELTGRKVLVIFALFFGTIASADAFLIVSALRSWSGAETTSAYKAGQLYNREIALARAQSSRGWAVEPRAERGPDGTALIRVEARDDAGRPLSGYELRVSLQRPTDRRADRSASLVETEAGSYAATVPDLAPGQWDLVVDMLQAEERSYRRRARVVLR